MTFWLKRIKRALDDKPIAAHLYVTDRCNLDCAYCTEYDNSVPHPHLTDLKKWIRKIRDLGCIRIGLQGGEPLAHPNIVEIVRHCTSLGLRTTMSTNGFLLNRDLVRGLEAAGLAGLQLSVDGMNPLPSTRKSLKTIIPKLQHLKESRIPFHISGVLFKETVKEARQVLDYGLSHGISTHARLVHTAWDGRFRVDPGAKQELADLIEYQVNEKKKGRGIHTTWNLLRYQKHLLSGESVDWTCLAGYKFFFVSAKGKFWLCSMNHDPDVDLMDVTPSTLRSYLHKKECQTGCGVYCVVSESLATNAPVKFLAREVGGYVSGVATGPRDEVSKKMGDPSERLV